MGPLTKASRVPKGVDSAYNWLRHGKCQQGLNCKGPGCAIRTGKTDKKRKSE